VARGFTRYAKRNEIRIQRPANTGAIREIPIVWDAIADGDNQHMNIVMLPGDTIIVP